MLLQSHRSFDTLAEFDPATGAFEEFSRSNSPGRSVANGKEGVFDYLGGHRVLLFRSDTELFVQVDNQRVNVCNLSIKVVPTTAGKSLWLHSNCHLIASFEYNLPSNFPVDDDPTAFAEAEDFDFGLFLANVSSDRLRQARMFV